MRDDATPTNITDSITFGGNTTISAVLAPLDVALVYDKPTTEYLAAGTDGHLYIGEIAEPAATSPQPGPVEGCGYLVETGGTTTIPLSDELFEYGWVVDVAYFVGSEVTVDVRAGATEVELKLSPPDAETSTTTSSTSTTRSTSSSCPG